MKLMQRDRDIIEFLKICKCANTESISDVFFNGSIRACQRRLKILSEADYVRRFKQTHWDEYIYYIGNKPRQWNHDVYLSKLIAYLKKNSGAEILKVKGATKIGDIICDGIIACKINNKVQFFFIEIEKNFRNETVSKYKELYKDGSYKNHGFPIAPSLILLTDKTITDYNNLPFELLISKLDNIELNLEP